MASAFGGRWSLAHAAPPDAAVSITATRACGAALASRSPRTIGAYAVRALPAGALVPSLTAANVIDAPAVSRAVGEVLEQLGRPRRIGLVLPDPVAKVSLLRFEQVPARAQDLDQLVAWQLRKAVPFAIEDAQVGYAPAGQGPDGQAFLATLARRSVIEEYEALCAAANAHAGIIDIATTNVVNAVLAGDSAPAGDWVLVHLGSDYTSIAIVREGQPIFFRTRPDRNDAGLSDLVHQTAMYYEDRLQGRGLDGAMVSGAAETASRPSDVEAPRRIIEDRLRVAVTPVDAAAIAALPDRVASNPPLADTVAPLLGVMTR